MAEQNGQPAARLCPACAGQFDPEGAQRCPVCGFARKSDDGGDVADWLNDRLGGASEVELRLPHDIPADWHLTRRALLHAVQRAGLWAEGVRVSGLWSRWNRFHVTIRRPPSPEWSHRVGLVVLCCQRDLALAIKRVGELAERMAEVVLMIDLDEVPPETDVLAPLSNVRSVCRRLRGNFSAQRNAATRMIGSDWVLHLDADEEVSESLLSELPKQIAFAERHGLAVLGLPRQNWVDGKLSDVYPDYQFRLHRVDQKWTRKVHEVPVACVKRWREVWRMSADSQAAIIHHLTREGLAEKAKLYDSIEDGMGRTDGIRSILQEKEDE
ncbi:MAG: hypothetical protein ACOCVI_00045 [Planctomycetota bacterium]